MMAIPWMVATQLEQFKWRDQARMASLGPKF